MFQQTVDGDLVALHHIEHAVRNAGLLGPASPGTALAEGSFSDGLRMNVLPHAMALENIHIGTIAGKLNGVMPADDAQRLADLIDVDAAAGLFAVAAFEQIRNAAGELDVLQPARHFAQRVGQRLAVFQADDLGDAGGGSARSVRAGGT